MCAERDGSITKGFLMRSFHIVLITALMLPACAEDVDSTDVRTSGVYAEIDVLAAGNGKSEVTTDLRVGGSDSNTHLKIKGEDELVATGDGVAKTMSLSGFLYKASFDVEAEDTEFVVAFMRGPDDDDAPNSNATLPAPFVLAGVESGAQVARAAGFQLTWTAATVGDGMSWQLDGDCLFPQTGSMSDTGQLRVDPSDFKVHSGEEQNTCNASICVSRSRNGQLDPAYGEGGVIKAAQRRCIAFVSTP
jgi:hypothetical protein